MNRRTLFTALAGLAAALLPVAALAKTAPDKSCTKCGHVAHFHRISRTPVYDHRYNGFRTDSIAISHYHEKWMTPRGEVSIARWPTMDDSHTMAAVEDAMFAIYPHG
jgi:hypothetical protein